jgi:hypothetical protein
MELHYVAHRFYTLSEHFFRLFVSTLGQCWISKLSLISRLIMSVEISNKDADREADECKVSHYR